MIRRVPKRHSLAVAITIALLAPGAGVASVEPGRSLDVLPDRPVFTSLAGSGALGIADGPAPQASFVAPAAVAFDNAGNLVVADRDAQRIRVVAADGSVKTLAGSGALLPFGSGVGGGYTDGPAISAQFNMPEAVLALPDGSVLVADTGNYCLRTIAHGIVSTFAGNHLDFKGIDGSLASARFTTPRSLARTSNGTIFVADPPNGVRMIANGKVTTLHFSDSTAVVSVASIPGDPDRIAVATATTVETIDYQRGTVVTSIPLESGFVKVAAREGGRPFGPPSSIVALSPTEFVVTDPLNSTVRMLQHDAALGDDYTRVLTAIPDENAAFGSAGFLDGEGITAKVDEPLGIALSSRGEIAIADTGNRRIRLLGAFNHTTHITVDLAKSELPDAPNPKEYRIALVGNSYIWFDQAWHESIGGMVEDALLASHATGSRSPKVYPIMRLGLPTMEALSIVDNELADGNFDAVVVDIANYGQIFSPQSVLQQYPDGWLPTLVSGLKRTARGLTAAHELFVVVDHPGAADFPDEFSYRRLPKGLPAQNGDTVEQRDPAAIEFYHDRMSEALAQAGIPIVDLWPTFLQAYAAPERVPLFETWDHHLSPAGRRLVAGGIAADIAARLHP